MAEPKKQFTQAFRDEAVRLVQTSGRSRREIAEDLGVGLSTLRNWIDVRRRRAMDEPPRFSRALRGSCREQNASS
jgi:transposase